MNEMKHDLGLRSIKCLNAILMSVPLALVWFFYYSNAIPFEIDFFYRAVVAVGYLVLYALLAHTYDGFFISLFRKTEIVYSQMLAAFIADCIVFVVICLLTYSIPNILLMLAVVAAQFVISLLWTVLANLWYFSTYSHKKTAIIYDLRRGMDDL
ncbi:MAG: sugar transferase, partial [Clostridia bacterium]|nr:sugar transferase [Clostridia bacterium]